MPLLLVRHAIAIPGAAWTGPDRDRSLTDAGRRQAQQLVSACACHDVDHVICSPALRCVQTVEPTAHARNLAVQPHPDLAEGRRAGARELLASLTGADALVCTHADALKALVRGLMRRGLALTDPPRWANAEAWVLDESAPTPSLTRLALTST